MHCDLLISIKFDKDISGKYFREINLFFATLLHSSVPYCFAIDKFSCVIHTPTSYIHSHAHMTNPTDWMNPDKSRQNFFRKLASGNSCTIVISLKNLYEANENENID